MFGHYHHRQMLKPRNLATVLVVVFSLAIMTTNAALAAPGGNGNGNGHGSGSGGTNPPTVSATPELDSLVLFGTGAATIMGYALTRVRARRDRKDD